MQEDYESMYEELLQFLYRTPWGLIQATRSGDIQMLNPVAAKVLMPLAFNGRLDNLFALLRAARPELQALVAATTERYGVVGTVLRIIDIFEILPDPVQRYYDPSQFPALVDNSSPLLPGEWESTPNVIWIFGNCVANVVWLKEPVAFLVEDKNVADAYKRYFSLLWRMSKPVKN